MRVLPTVLIFLALSFSQSQATDTGSRTHDLKDSAGISKIHLDSIPRIPKDADSILFIHSGLGNTTDDTIARFFGRKALEDLRNGVAEIRDSGKSFSPSKSDSADLGLVIFSPNESAKRIITLARRYHLNPATKKSELSIVGVSLQYSVEAFSLINLSKSYANKLEKIYETNRQKRSVCPKKDESH